MVAAYGSLGLTEEEPIRLLIHAGLYGPEEAASRPERLLPAQRARLRWWDRYIADLPTNPFDPSYRGVHPVITGIGQTPSL